MAATRVVALKDFTYDDKLGKVYQGQVFSLGGYVNDGKLLAHRFVAEYSGKTCQDSKGRMFSEEGLRERAGRLEERTPGEVLQERRDRAADRVMTVGA